MQSQTTPRRHPQTASTDFDFGQAAGSPRATPRRPGIAAGLVAVAFALSMFIPVAAKADPAWMLYPDQLSAPARPKAAADVILVENPNRSFEDLIQPARGKSDKRRDVPAVCALQIDGRQGGFNWYSENCMRDHGLRGKLPRGCATSARLFGVRDRVYTADCLRNSGFKLQRR